MCAACTPEEVNKCVDQAKAAQKLWAKVPLWKRAEYLHSFAKILRTNKDPIAKCLTNEVGKCLKDAIVEVIDPLLENVTNFKETLWLCVIRSFCGFDRVISTVFEGT